MTIETDHQWADKQDILKAVTDKIKHTLNCEGIDNLLDTPDYKLAEMLIAYCDDSPLTDGALEELGFENTFGGVFYPITDMIKLEVVELEPQKKIVVVIDGNYNDKTVPHWETVGKVRMLIEALKGDE